MEFGAVPICAKLREIETKVKVRDEGFSEKYGLTLKELIIHVKGGF